ncbi:MAG TPA: hypothetical protein VKR56_11755 [Candidatus Cybelea sp.]|nr:hypothetical protein [Candidatus Cybelea sp.]
MFVRIASRFLIGTLGLLGVLSGCVNGSNTGVPSAANLGRPISMTGAFHDNNGKGHGGGQKCKGNFTKGGGSKGGGSIIYTTQMYGHDVKVYNVGGTQGLSFSCYVSNGVDAPDGTVATVNGWLYVANGNGNDVLVYRTKHGMPQGPESSLTDANFPTNVNTDPNRQVVAVSNLGTSSENGNVYIYLHRQSVKSRTLTYGGSGTVYGAGIAISHNGDCFWGFNGTASNSGEIVEFPKCNGSGTVVRSGIGKVGGVIFDQSDDLYFVDTYSGIWSCDKTSGSSCKILTPLSKDLVGPTNMNFDYKGKDLWVADPAGGFIDEINPVTGAIELPYSAYDGASDPPFGIAPEPG